MLPVSALFRFVPCNPSFQMVLSPALGRFLMCVHCLILRVKLEIIPGNLCAALSSSEFCLQTLATLTFLDFPIHFFNSQRLLSSAEVLPPCSAVWKLGSNCRAHLVSFLSPRVTVCCLKIGLKTYFLYWVYSFVVLGRKVNLVPVTPTWPELDVITDNL